jgi:hypothetical protein
MPKVIKSNTALIDREGEVWVEAELSDTQIKRLIKAYDKFQVSLKIK